MQEIIQEGEKVLYKGFIYEIWAFIEDRVVLMNTPKIKPIFFVVSKSDIKKVIKEIKWN